MSILDFARRELDAIGMTEVGDEMNVAMRNDVLKIVSVFAEQGHSGFSANYAINLLQRLLRFEPLSPLTGEDAEWNDVSEYDRDDGGHVVLYQNKRCGRVFKEVATDGTTHAYDIDGKVFDGPDGFRYTNKDSRVPITFPYTPTTEIVKATA